MNKNVKVSLLKHKLLKEGVKEDYLPFAIGEIDENIFCRRKEQNRVHLFKVDSKAKEFNFNEAEFLDQLALSPENSSKKKPWDFRIKIYTKKIEGALISDLVQEFDVSQRSVSTYIKEVKGRIAEARGLAYEQFRAEKLKEEFPEAKITVAAIALNEPDISLESNEITHFYSLKLRKLPASKATEKLNLIKKFKPEYHAAMAKESKMLIDFYNELNHTHSVKEVDISKVNENSSVLLKWTGDIEIKY